MLFVFLVFAVVMATWGTIIVVAMKKAEREEERAKDETRKAVRRTIGLAIDGNPLGSCIIGGNVHGVDLTIDIGASHPLPGPSEERREATTISGATVLADQIVCRRADVDYVMGALPAVPRQTLGDAAFDERYAVFLGVGDTAQAPTGYRDGSPPAPALAWTDPTIMKDMIAQGLVYMRVKEGRCVLAFGPTRAENVAPLVATAANVLRRASGQSLVSAPSEKPVVTPPASYSNVSSVMFVALGSIFLAPVGAVLGFLPPLRELNEETECGAGGKILVSESSDGDGTSYGLYCSNDHHASLFGHYTSAVALYFTVVFAIATFVGLRQWPKKRIA